MADPTQYWLQKIAGYERTDIKWGWVRLPKAGRVRRKRVALTRTASGGVNFNRDGKITGGERLDANGDGKIDESKYWGLLNGLRTRGKTYVPILKSIGQPAYRFMLNMINPDQWCNSDDKLKYGNALGYVGDEAVPFLKQVLLKGRKTRQAKAAVYVLKNMGSEAAADALVSGLVAKADDELLENNFR